MDDKQQLAEALEALWFDVYGEQLAEGCVDKYSVYQLRIIFEALLLLKVRA